MGSRTYKARGLVLRKTKLGESDLIITLLAENGSQLRAVAKGARKPTSSFAARLELGAVCDIFCSVGKSLDIVKEVRLVQSNELLRRDLEHTTAVAPMLELLDRSTQMSLENEKLFPMSVSALEHMQQSSPQTALALCAAHLLKTLAYLGVRPNLDSCALCGTPLDLSSSQEFFFSYAEGGLVCKSCRMQANSVIMQAETLLWINFLLKSIFTDIVSQPVPTDVSFSVLHVCQEGIREHLGFRLKSLSFLFTCGLFE